VVLGIAPARDALQRVVDRFVRGPRIDPMTAVALAAVRGEGDLVVRVLHSVAEALAAPYAAVLQDGVEVASVGIRSGAGATAGLHYGETYLGELVVECRQPALLHALAPQVAVVVHAAGLNADLDAARQQAVGAALAERGRLRRDLHDGLGPSLSGVALGLEAAAATLDSDPVSTRAVLARARDEVGTAVAEVRRLLDGLHPPELGSYGLAAALRERLLLAGAGPEVVVEAPAALPPMAPAVELAAFRIVSEAVTNARRHACARRCDVRLEVRAGVLRIAVEDDGHGIPADAAAGVGLVSMRHRAEEVGGWLKVDGSPTGTRVEAELPVSA
jgi:signal transduction histidine kinase